MVKIGQFNFLKIFRKTARGTFLEAGNLGQVFLPVAQTPSHCEVGDKIQVFLYRDSHDEVVATTKKPRIEIGGTTCLKVLSVSRVGAFLDWGLPKDLLAPFGEQSKKMEVGEFHIVHAYEDNTGRLCASSKLNKFIKAETSGLKAGDSVNLIVGDQTDLGYKMIVNQAYWGLLHHDDIFREIKYGQKLKGFIKKLRADKRIDITLKQPGVSGDKSLASKILAKIESGNGFSAINDKSPPELIYQEFGVSKKVFKAELGALYKQRKILIGKDGIRFANTDKH
ncbi:CvfB family protein [Aliikangiella coralliicola]|uniref:GntR family transcriptional regulator n=1 Tax=Aliikangiella coralliicola TaxID=2592383 RepID=A0A545UJS4_9GAMM|nr:S1-like domain-containing RNA-binding protein [Aliikangiella coralliicola]TQV89718.1 GntR family transcriptional regulator [Aliikangiella coralliicola]